MRLHRVSEELPEIILREGGDEYSDLCILWWIDGGVSEGALRRFNGESHWVESDYGMVKGWTIQPDYWSIIPKLKDIRR